MKIWIYSAYVTSNMSAWMNNYVLGYADYKNQNEKNIKKYVGGVVLHFRVFLSMLLVILKFEICC